MDSIYCDKTQDSPDVILDKEKNKLYFGGRSLAENPVEFYKPIIKWLELYIENPNENTILEFSFDYFNSTTARIIANMLGKFESLSRSGKQVEILWGYKANDKDMLEAGQRFSEAFAVKFKFLSF